MSRLIPTVSALVFTLGLNAQSAPLEVEAKFVKVLLTATGQFGFACNDPALKAKLESMGIAVGPGFKLAWGSSEPEVRALKAQDRCIICPRQEWLKSGASLAVVVEDGQPVLYADPNNIKASGLALPDAILKVAKVG